MELKTEALFIYGCYAPETEVGCRARATYPLPLAFFLSPSASLPLFRSAYSTFTRLYGNTVAPFAGIVFKQREASTDCTPRSRSAFARNPPFMRVLFRIH